MKASKVRIHVVATCLILPTSAVLAQPSFQGLGALHPSRPNSSASAVSADGSVVVGRSLNEAFLWTAKAGMVGLGQLPYPFGEDSHANGVSGDGLVVVGYGVNYDGEAHPSAAFLWAAETGMVSLGAGTCPDGSRAFGVNGDGSVVVGTMNCGSFRWTEETGFVFFGGGAAYAVTPDGNVVVGYRAIINWGGMAFRWTAAGGVQDLGDLPGGLNRSQANAVSADGSVVVGESHTDSGWEAFRWSERDGMVGLGGLPGAPPFSGATAVSSDGGLVIGVAAVSTKETAPFLWDAGHGMRPLQEVLATDYGLADALKGWTLRSATAISTDSRTIVGWGRNPEGWSEAWRAHLGDACRADFNADAVVNSQDFFDFLFAFFAGDADFNIDGATDTQDFFDFLTAFFEGCA